MDSENDLSSPILPTGKTNAGTQNLKVASFDKALEEGTKDLQNLTTPKKNKGGRPADPPDVKEQKRQARNARRRKGFDPENEPKNEYGAPPERNVFQSAGEPSAPAEPFPEMDMRPILRQGLQMPFKMWAAKTRCPKLEVTNEELEAPVEYANQLFNYYAPRMESMDPGKAAVVMFSISMLMLVGEKSAVLAEYQSAVPTTGTTVERSENNAQSQAPAQPPPQSVPGMPQVSFSRG